MVTWDADSLSELWAAVRIVWVHHSDLPVGYMDTMGNGTQDQVRIHLCSEIWFWSNGAVIMLYMLGYICYIYYMYVYIYTHTHIYTYSYIHIIIQIYVYIYTHMYTYIHIYIYMYMLYMLIYTNI